jgi:hypothetical protein
LKELLVEPLLRMESGCDLAEEISDADRHVNAGKSEVHINISNTMN